MWSGETAPVLSDPRSIIDPMNEPRSTPDEVAAWAVAQPPG
ncbi:MAG: hypothetical protein QOK11_255, partial [Pseudonocardiales bacterium]|nr:hypothetical protein [Pseudonocardiales bacterium]